MVLAVLDAAIVPNGSKNPIKSSITNKRNDINMPRALSPNPFHIQKKEQQLNC